MNTMSLRQQCKFLGMSTLLLVGCGGGGDDSGTAPPPSGPVVLPLVTSVPSPTYTDTYTRDAFIRINEIRRQLDLGLITQNTTIDTAAVNHANYLITNNEVGHTETDGKPFYTGASPLSRLRNYHAAAASEVINFDPRLSGRQVVDQLISTVYHRMPFLNHSLVDVGLGRITSSSTPDRGAFVMDFAIPLGTHGQAASTASYILWPANGSVINNVEMAPETPSPGGKGYAISFNVTRGLISTVKTFELREAGTALVPAVFLSDKTDPNKLIGADFVALSPVEPLKHLTSYTVVFDGTVDGKPVTLTWGFSTP